MKKVFSLPGLRGGRIFRFVLRWGDFRRSSSGGEQRGPGLEGQFLLTYARFSMISRHLYDSGERPDVSFS